MTEYTLSQWMLFFYVYSFVGWVWECFYVSARHRKWVNRGFLKGPFLPIYGSGAVCILVVTIPFRESIPLMFLVGMVAASILEYVTGSVMEKLFGVRYWDYSDQFMNLNGHICLGVSLCWGVLAVLLVRVVHIRVEELVLRIPEAWGSAAAQVITIGFTADCVTSFHAAFKLRDFLIQNERLAEELQKLTQRRKELEESAALRREELAQKYEEMEQSLTQRREELETALEQQREALTQKYEELGRSAAQRRAELQDAGEKAREELQALYMEIGALKERVQNAQTKGVRGLLKRNPTASSQKYRDSFAELKKTIADRLEEIRNEKDAE